MSLTTPTTAEINANIIAQLESSLAQTIPLLPKSFMRVLAAVIAGVYITLYKYGGWSSLQMFVSTASNEPTTINGKTLSPLTEWGRLVGVGDPIGAVGAELTVDVTVFTTGGNLQSGTQFLAPDTGVVYLSTSLVALVAGTISVPIRAVSDQSGGNGLGAIGNLENGAAVNFVSPIASVAPGTVVTATTITGVDAETTEAYRQRVIDRFQKRPQGGAYADYEEWGEEVAGIANVYPYTGVNPGEVDVFVESATEVDGIPTAQQLLDVAASIELDENGLASRRPAGAFVNTLSIIRTTFDVTVSGVFAADQAQVEVDITTGITEYFLARAPFIEGLSIPPRTDVITQSGVAGVVEDIVSAASGIFTAVSVSLGGVNTVSYSLGAGEKAKVGTVTFV